MSTSRTPQTTTNSPVGVPPVGIPRNIQDRGLSQGRLTSSAWVGISPNATGAASHRTSDAMSHGMHTSSARVGPSAAGPSAAGAPQVKNTNHSLVGQPAKVNIPDSQQQDRPAWLKCNMPERAEPWTFTEIAEASVTANAISCGLAPIEEDHSGTFFFPDGRPPTEEDHGGTIIFPDS